MIDTKALRELCARASAVAPRKLALMTNAEWDYWEAFRNAADELLNAYDEREGLRAAKDDAYHERNMLVAALSKCFPSHLSRHSDEDKTWDDDWRWIVYIEIPVRAQIVFGDMHNVIPESEWFKTLTRQVSWHIHDSERELFNHLDVRENRWDGHNTERKYQRLAALAVFDASTEGKK